MNRIDLPHLVWALESLVAGTVVNRIEVDPDTEHWAKVALQRMLDLPGQVAPRLSAATACSSARAARTRTVVPPPGVAVERRSAPPCASTIRRHGGQADPVAGLGARVDRAPAARRPAPGPPSGTPTAVVGDLDPPAGRPPGAAGHLDLGDARRWTGELGGVGHAGSASTARSWTGVAGDRRQVARPSTAAVVERAVEVLADVGHHRRRGRPRQPGQPAAEPGEGEQVVDQRLASARRRRRRASSSQHRGRVERVGVLELLLDQPQRHRHGGRAGSCRSWLTCPANAASCSLERSQLGAEPLQLGTVPRAARVRSSSSSRSTTRSARAASARAWSSSSCRGSGVEDAERADDHALRGDQLVGGVEADVADLAGHERVVAERGRRGCASGTIDRAARRRSTRLHIESSRGQTAASKPYGGDLVLLGRR